MNLELTNMCDETIKAICAEYKLSNADVHIRCNATVD
jgi:ribosome-interacting GTPase 1